MSKPRLLDLFCGAGGATRGYQLAGFHVTGVDLKPQPRYCGDDFHQADALEFASDPGLIARCFDAVHASPPCQAYTQAALTWRRRGKEYPRLIEPTRELLRATGLPWVLENVPDAPIRADYILCGCMVDLELRRERWFETSWRGFEMSHPHRHTHPVVSVVGHGTPSWVRERLGRNPTIAEYRAAMGIDWMNRNELSEAIPPAYTEFIGSRLLSVVEQAA